jgi:hypothetical protein
VGGFIALEGDGSASGRWSRPIHERGQTSPWWRGCDVGGLASLCTGVEAERAERDR